MLDLIIFAPCDKVIVAEGGQTSMVGILEAIKFGVPKNVEFPADAMVPYKWGILTLWHRTQEVETPISCKSKMILERPDGTEALKIEGSFVVSNDYRNFRQNVELPFMAAGQKGEHLLKLSLQIGDEDWKEVTTFPIFIDHKESDIKVNVLQNVEVQIKNE